MPRRVRAARVYAREAGVSDCPMFRHEWASWFSVPGGRWWWRECWACHVVQVSEEAPEGPIVTDCPARGSGGR
jgi:hypothetical protein